MSPRIQLVVAAALFSTGGAAIKWVNLPGWQVAGARAAIALLAMVTLIPGARRGWSWRTAVVGCGYAATTLLYVLANKLTTAANAIFLQATNPLFILALAPWLLGERVSRRDLAHMVVLGIGLALFFVGVQRRFATAPDPLLGNVLAACSALTWALTVIGYRWLATRTGGGGGSVAAAAASGSLIALLVALPMALPLRGGRPTDWLMLAYLGVFQLGLAYVFITRAVPRVSALDVSLLMLIEPVLNPIWAWWLHGETPTLAALGGAGVILGATVLRSWPGVPRAEARARHLGVLKDAAPGRARPSGRE